MKRSPHIKTWSRISALWNDTPPPPIQPFEFDYNPQELMFLCSLAEEALDGGGAVIKIGPSLDHTATFLARFLEEDGRASSFQVIDLPHDDTPGGIDDTAASLLEWTEPVAFCLVNAGGYLPVLQILDRVFPRLVPGGIIAISDCSQQQPIRGASHAWQDYAAVTDQPEITLMNQFGLLRREVKPTRQEYLPISSILTID